MLKKISLYLQEVFCEHDWEIEKVDVYGSHAEYRTINGHVQFIDVVDDIPKGTKWRCFCKKCGAIKIKKDY